MDSCYVNLNIVEQDVRDDQHVDHVQPPNLDLSLAERLGRSEFEERWKLNDGKEIHLPDLFNPRKFSNEKEERRPRRILIRGRAGVGKSTLCKKIIGDFLQLQRTKNSTKDDSVDLRKSREHSYCSHFARIIWVPLGNLATRQDRDFWEWLLGMYFAPMMNPEAKPMAEALRAHLQSHYDKDDTLFLLDGMDEIAARLQDGSILKESVDWLIGQRNVIVTSRPSVRFDQSLERETFDMELETIGFYQNQVEDYVAKVEQLHASNILEFLKIRPLIQDLVRIPVQLDALCFAWKDAASRNMNRRFALETMTGLYQAIEGALWRKDSYRLDKTAESDTPLPSEIEKIMKGEIALLENLAFHGMCEGLTIFDEFFLDRILKELQEEFQPQKGLDYTLQRLSFLRSPEVSPGQARRNYYFLHLTHQEYFAARHLKRQWVEGNAKGVDAIGFFRGHKYSERFDIVWRFLSGLLGSYDDESYSRSGFKTKYEYGPKGLEPNQLERYFKEIRQEPLDMLGPIHQRLVMRCLCEVPTSRSLPARENLEKQLENWLLFEYDFRQEMSYHRGWLANDMEFPEHILERLLTDRGDEHLRARLLRSLKPRHTTRPEIISLVTSWIEQQDSPVLRESISMFETFPETSFSEKVICIIMKKLNDADFSVRYEAGAVFRRMMKSSALSQLALEEIMRALDFHYDSFIKTRVLDDHHASLFETDLEIVHTYVSRPSEKLLSKVARVITSLPHEKYVPKTEGKQQQIQKAALSILFDEQVSLPPDVSDTLIKWMKDVDLLLHDDTLRALIQQPTLRPYLVENAIQKLKSDNQDWHSIAITIMASHPALPEATWMELVENAMQKFKSYSPGLRSIAFWVLGHQKVLPEATRMELIETAMQRFKSKHPNLCSFAFSVLGSQPVLSEATRMELMENSIHKLKSEDREMQRVAINVLSSQPVLPEAISIKLIQLFMTIDQKLDLTNYNHFREIQKAAMKILEQRDRLQEAVLRSLVQLFNTGRDTAKQCAHRILHNQSELSETILDMLARSLETGDLEFQKEIGKFLRKRSNLSESTLRILARGLQHENPSIQEATLRALPLNQHLPDEILRQAVGLLMSKHLEVVDSALDVLQGCQNLHVMIDQISRWLKDKDRNTRKRALKIFEHREPSNEILSEIDELIDDEEPCIRQLALKIFIRSVNGSKRLDIIEMMLEDKDSEIREHALETVIDNNLSAELSDPALDQVAQMLEGDTRGRVGNVLKGAKRLTPKLVQLVTGRLEDGNLETRVATLKSLTNMKALPQIIIDDIRQKLRDPDPHVQSAAIDLLFFRQDLLSLALEVLQKGLQDEDLYPVSDIIRCYLHQQSPPARLLPIVLQNLNSMRDVADLFPDALPRGEDDVRLDALLLLRSPDTCQSDQPMSLLEFMVQNLGPPHSRIRELLIDLAGREFKFPVESLDVILQMLEDDVNHETIWSTFTIIEAIDDWPQGRFFQTMARILQNDHARLRGRILRILSKQPSLPEWLLIPIATLFEGPPQYEDASLLTITLKHPELATICASRDSFLDFYQFLLEQSFNERLVWLHRSSGSHHSGDRSQWCYQTVGEEVKNELVKARRRMLGPELALDGGS